MKLITAVGVLTACSLAAAGVVPNYDSSTCTDLTTTVTIRNTVFTSVVVTSVVPSSSAIASVSVSTSVVPVVPTSVSSTDNSGNIPSSSYGTSSADATSSDIVAPSLPITYGASSSATDNSGATPSSSATITVVIPETSVPIVVYPTVPVSSSAASSPVTVVTSATSDSGAIPTYSASWPSYGNGSSEGANSPTAPENGNATSPPPAYFTGGAGKAHGVTGSILACLGLVASMLLL